MLEFFGNITQDIRNGDIYSLVSYLNKGETLSGVVDRNGNTPLSVAIECGYSDIVKILIEAGANVNKKKSFLAQKTPLSIAIEYGRSDIIEMLVEAGADYDLREFPEVVISIISANYKKQKAGMSNVEINSALRSAGLVLNTGHASDKFDRLIEGICRSENPNAALCFDLILKANITEAGIPDRLIRVIAESVPKSIVMNNYFYKKQRVGMLDIDINSELYRAGLILSTGHINSEFDKLITNICQSENPEAVSYLEVILGINIAEGVIPDRLTKIINKSPLGSAAMCNYLTQLSKRFKGLSINYGVEILSTIETELQEYALKEREDFFMSQESYANRKLRESKLESGQSSNSPGSIDISKEVDGKSSSIKYKGQEGKEFDSYVKAIATYCFNKIRRNAVLSHKVGDSKEEVVRKDDVAVAIAMNLVSFVLSCNDKFKSIYGKVEKYGTESFEDIIYLFAKIQIEKEKKQGEEVSNSELDPKLTEDVLINRMVSKLHLGQISWSDIDDELADCDLTDSDLLSLDFNFDSMENIARDILASKVMPKIDSEAGLWFDIYNELLTVGCDLLQDEEDGLSSTLETILRSTGLSSNLSLSASVIDTFSNKAGGKIVDIYPKIIESIKKREESASGEKEGPAIDLSKSGADAANDPSGIASGQEARQVASSKVAVVGNCDFPLLRGGRSVSEAG